MKNVSLFEEIKNDTINGLALRKELDREKRKIVS